jgi:hypothetical protein
MQIPDHIQVALGTSAEVTEQELVGAIEANGIAEVVFGLSVQEFLAAASTAASGSFEYEAHRASRPVRDWRYLELSAGGSLECVATFVPVATGQKPPTAAAQLLAAAWFTEPQVVTQGQIEAQMVVCAFATAGAHGRFARRLVSEWEGACPLVEGVNVPPVWFAKCQIGIADQARLISPSNASLRFAELFLEAVSEVKTKWRFLSLYRTLEHGYLSELFHCLEGQFFAAPRESVVAALAALDSELNQFITLAEGAGVKAHFEAFCEEFEALKSAGNKFALAVDRSIDKSGQLKTLNGKWRKGVLIFYKIRCAIVHAGMSSPIFDAYPDGTACLDKLMPISEAAVLDFLGLSVA